jgi:hypothetical protein
MQFIIRTEVYPYFYPYSFGEHGVARLSPMFSFALIRF